MRDGLRVGKSSSSKKGSSIPASGVVTILIILISRSIPSFHIDYASSLSSPLSSYTPSAPPSTTLTLPQHPHHPSHPPSMPPQKPPKKRVLIVGAGAAGMSCAEQLSQHPDRFDVTLVESQDYCGGQAFSIPIDEKKFGAGWMNQGVQGYVSSLFEPVGEEGGKKKLTIGLLFDGKQWILGALLTF